MAKICHLLLRNAAQTPHGLAVATEHAQVTWAQLDETTDRLAHGLTAAGLGRGARLAVLWPGGIQWLTIWYAALKAGAVMVPINARLRAAEVARIVEVSECDALFYASTCAAQAGTILAATNRPLIPVTDGSPPPGGVRWEEVADPPHQGPAAVTVPDEDPCLILFTSGTTGPSKGVVRSRGMVMAHALSLAGGIPAGDGVGAGLRVSTGDGVPASSETQAPPFLVTSAPVYHTAAFVAILKMAALGGGIGLLPRLDPEVICTMITRHQASEILLVPPAVYQRLTPVASHYDLTSVREVLVTGGTCTPGTSATIAGLFPQARLKMSWGSTEACSVTGGLITREQVAADPRLLTSIGTPNPTTQVRLVRADGTTAAPGEIGEAWVRSPMVATAYLGAGPGEEEVFRDGWYRTGDLLRQEGDLLFFVDRVRDIVKSGGENVSALEVERALTLHPAIAECAVVGVADSCLGEAIAAALVLAPGATLTGDELTAFARSQLESYKKPRYWALLDSLPVNSSGKVTKTELRRQAASLFIPLGQAVPRRIEEGNHV
jgi:acyl-CoA synthetase (AMP-forming)/AMP-acid ligase II